MSTSQGELIQPGLSQSIWQNKWVKIAIQALLLVVFSATTAFMKRIHPSIGIPSSSAPFWLTAMIVARCTMDWPGSGTLVGAGTAAWGIPIRLEQAFGQNFASFGIAGLTLDVMMLIPKMDIRKWWGAILCALVANLSQFGVILYSSLTATVVKHFEVVGILNSLGLHVAFGIAAGIMGWAIYRGGEMGLRKLTK